MRRASLATRGFSLFLRSNETSSEAQDASYQAIHANKLGVHFMTAVAFHLYQRMNQQNWNCKAITVPERSTQTSLRQGRSS